MHLEPTSRSDFVVWVSELTAHCGGITARAPDPLLPVGPVVGFVGPPLPSDEGVWSDAHNAALPECGDRRIDLGNIVCTAT